MLLSAIHCQCRGGDSCPVATWRHWEVRRRWSDRGPGLLDLRGVGVRGGREQAHAGAGSMQARLCHSQTCNGGRYASLPTAVLTTSLQVCNFQNERRKNWRVLGSHPVPVRRENGARSPLSWRCRTAKAALGPESCSQQGTEASRDVGDIYGFKSLHRDIMALPWF